MSKPIPVEVSNFRKMMYRLGFRGCSIRALSVPEGYFSVCAFDPMNEKVPFARMYTLEEMRCICHASNIFWRYIK